jgi:hypothetical protein
MVGLRTGVIHFSNLCLVTKVFRIEIAMKAMYRVLTYAVTFHVCRDHAGLCVNKIILFRATLLE